MFINSSISRLVLSLVTFDGNNSWIDVYLLSHGSDVSSTTLEGVSPLHTPRVAGSMEQIQATNSTVDVEAIQDILSEMADMR